MAVFFSLNRIN